MRLCLSPEPIGDGEGIDTQLQPPFPFFGGAMHLAVMHPAERHREFIADLAAECHGLREAQMMGVCGLAAANEARLRRDKFPVLLVAQPTRFGCHGVTFKINGRGGGWGRGVFCRSAVQDHLGMRRRRALQDQLSKKASVGIVTVRQLEAGTNGPAPKSHSRRHKTCSSGIAGVEFVDENGGGPGVRLRKAAKGKSRK